LGLRAGRIRLIYRLSLSMEDSTSQQDANEVLSPRSATALRELEERARSVLSAQQGHLSRLEDQISKRLEAISAAIADERTAEAESLKKVESSRTEVDRLRQELDESRAAWQAEKNDAEAELSKRRAEFDKLVAQNDKRAEQLAERAQVLDAQQAELEKQKVELAKREAKLKDNGAGSAALEAARAELERERDELQQKFELALQDVQRFRGRAADLEQELARRPETSQTDSAELVALRAERDALAERVEQLERQPVAEVDADTEQQISDLRRRFELAVEDVRELKTKNAELEAKLAAGGQRPAVAAAGDGMDWESQKQRLLASLADATDDEENPLPQKDRLTIENTIEMTDAVVAEKDREIEQLKAQLSTTAASEPDRAAQERDEKINELINSDEVIAEHRKRIEKIEREMEEKLRAAELELSVERAKMAREKVELEELRNDLESQRQSLPASGTGTSAAAAPRRRWLSKLGLSGDE
jgi:chromosome segregation ATPase